MIMGFTGPEGAGKTCLMTAYCHAHLELGGKLVTFPGYEITDGKGNVRSELINIDQWIALPDELSNVLIAIDEIQNFFDSYRWNSALANLFVALEAQRRKRNLGILFAVQDIAWLPPRIRQLTHIIAPCWDLYWAFRNSDEPIKRGEKITVTYYDCKGFYTGRPWTPSAPVTFHAKKYWDLYNSFAVVDIWEKFTKVKVKGREATLDLREPQELPPGFQPPQDEIPSQSALNKLEIVQQLMARGEKAADIGKLLGAMK